MIDLDPTTKTCLMTVPVRTLVTTATSGKTLASSRCSLTDRSTILMTLFIRPCSRILVTFGSDVRTDIEPMDMTIRT